MEIGEKNKAFRRTDRAIMDALIRLLEDRTFESITVQDILDETPVTRATFYAHYHDKYEVAEKMQDLYFSKIGEVRTAFSAADRDSYTEVLRKAWTNNAALVDALLKIHTDRVDISAVTEEHARQAYLKSHTGPNAEAEAEIYAKLSAAYAFTCYHHLDDALKDADYYDHVMVPVMAAAFNQERNPAFREAICRFLPGSR